MKKACKNFYRRKKKEEFLASRCSRFYFFHFIYFSDIKRNQRTFESGYLFRKFFFSFFFRNVESLEIVSHYASNSFPPTVADMKQNFRMNNLRSTERFEEIRILSDIREAGYRLKGLKSCKIIMISSKL